MNDICDHLTLGVEKEKKHPQMQHKASVHGEPFKFAANIDITVSTKKKKFLTLADDLLEGFSRELEVAQLHRILHHKFYS